MCVCVFLVRWVEGCERPHCWCQGQSASKDWFRLCRVFFCFFLCQNTLTHSQKHTVSTLSPLRNINNIKVYCSSSQPKTNIWSWRVNFVSGQRAYSNTVEWVRAKNKDKHLLFTTFSLHLCFFRIVRFMKACFKVTHSEYSDYIYPWVKWHVI